MTTLNRETFSAECALVNNFSRECDSAFVQPDSYPCGANATWFLSPRRGCCATPPDGLMSPRPKIVFRVVDKFRTCCAWTRRYDRLRGARGFGRENIPSRDNDSFSLEPQPGFYGTPQQLPPNFRATAALNNVKSQNPHAPEAGLPSIGSAKVPESRPGRVPGRLQPFATNPPVTTRGRSSRREPGRTRAPCPGWRKRP